MNLDRKEHYGILNPRFMNLKCWTFLILSHHCDQNVLDYYDRIDEQRLLGSPFTHIVWKYDAAEGIQYEGLCGIKRIRQFANFIFLSLKDNKAWIYLETILGSQIFHNLNIWRNT